MNLFPRRHALAAAVFAACAATTTSGIAAEADYSALAKDVNILARVLETATTPEGKRQHWEQGGARIEGLYLAGQGMVFRVRLHGGDFAHAFFTAPLPPVPPVPAVPAAAPVTRDGEVLIDSEEMEEIVEDAMSEARDAMDEMGFDSGMERQTRDELRALREAQRSAARAYRDRQRALAEAARGDKTPSQADRAAAEKAQKDFEAANQKLRARIASLRAEQQQKWQARVQKIETDLLDALCSYAGSTRRLTASEHVSLILDNEGDDEDGQHRIWVVRKSDLDACATGNQAADFLRKKATSYVL